MIVPKFCLRDDAQRILDNAKDVAAEHSHPFTTPLHLLSAMTKGQAPYLRGVLEKAGYKLFPLTRSVNRRLLDLVPRDSSLPGGPKFSPEANQVINAAFEITNSENNQYIHPSHIFLALLSHLDITLVFDNLSMSINKIESQVQTCRESAQKDLSMTDSSDKFKFLTRYAVDMTEQARKGEIGPVIGRDEEIRRCIDILARRKKPNLCLVGEPGVGKTSIGEGIAQWIINGDVPKILAKSRLFSLDFGALRADSLFPGDFMDCINGVLNDIKKSKDPIILFLDDMHAVGIVDPYSTSHLFKSLLACGSLRFIYTTTDKGCHKRVDEYGAFEERLQKIEVSEPTICETIAILRGLQLQYEIHHGVRIRDTALVTAAHLASRYFPHRKLPDSAVELIDETSANVARERDSRSQQFVSLGCELQLLQTRIKVPESDSSSDASKEGIVDGSKVSKTVFRLTGIPVSKLSADENLKLTNMENELSKQVIGQQEAIRAVANAVRMSRSGFSNPGAPPSFMFLGLPGTGKCELAKKLAGFLFANESAMTRINCSVLSGNGSSFKLLGAEHAYYRSAEGGILTDALIRNPYSVVVFDEVEKAAPEVLTILLQILDGSVRDSSGKVVNCSNCIVIMTSTLGAKHISSPSSVTIDPATREMVMESVRDHFEPEFINRISSMVVFNGLSKKAIWKIARIRLEEIEKRFEANNKHLHLQLDSAAIEYLVKRGYYRHLGARPLNWLIQNKIENRLAILLFHNQILDNETVNITCVDDELEIIPNHEAAADLEPRYNDSDSGNEFEDDNDAFLVSK